MIRGVVFDQFDDDDIRAALVGVGRRGPSDDDFASALWTCLVEPGDAAGGALRRAFGPAAALEALALDDAELERRLVVAGCADAARFDFRAARARWVPRRTMVQFRSALRCAATLGVRLIVPGDREWPLGLRDLGLHEPVALWGRGSPSALTIGPSVALVGSRAATGYGEQVAGELADSLAARGIAVHSGGAYGIDGVAHRAALAASGTTVAVMAGGVDRYYPSGHHDLLSRIADTGIVLSETACGTTPSKWRFLQRNRLLAAMTAATVVVEAGERSGALNTASHARALERPLGAVPGPVTSPASAGCHRLLREPDVACITGAPDVLQLLDSGLLPEGWSGGRGRDSPVEIRVLDALGRRPRTEAQVAADSGLAEAEVRATLAVLELAGRVAEREKGWVEAPASRKVGSVP